MSLNLPTVFQIHYYFKFELLVEKLSEALL